MSSASLPLKISIGLVMLVSAIELSFVTATVGYLALIGKQTFAAASDDDGTIVQVPGLPAHLEVNQGHTANGAAGTGFVVIGCAGLLALWLRGRPGYHSRTPLGVFGRAWYRLWLALNVPALLLTLGALAYVAAVTRRHGDQAIDLTAVPGSDGGADKYPLLTWTPQGWFAALAGLDLASGSDRDDIETHLRLARGWQYNLVPFFLVQLVQTALALLDARRRRKMEGQYAYKAAEQSMEQGVSYGAK